MTSLVVVVSLPSVAFVLVVAVVLVGSSLEVWVVGSVVGVVVHDLLARLLLWVSLVSEPYCGDVGLVGVQDPSRALVD